jgi:hypothetical protein
MPLTAAFLHIQQFVGGEQLAEEDLRLRLTSGDVEGQERWVAPGEGIHIIPLKPEDFEGPYPLLFGFYEGHNRFMRSVDRYRLDGQNFFLRRADVYRIWPIDGADWMPLVAAFAHIQQIVDGEQLAEEDLRLRLRSGDVKAEDRWVTPGEGIHIIPLAPEDFKDPYDTWLPPVSSHIDFLSRADVHRRYGHNIFLCRADVYREWPMRLAEPVSPPDEQPRTQPARDERGLLRRAHLS